MTGIIAKGDQAPVFQLEDQDGQWHSSADFQGKPWILYFYPKADTPGCTQESKDFAMALPKLSALGVTILGVSADAKPAQSAFHKKYCLPFPLLCDTEKTLCQAYGVWVDKSMYGKTYQGIERTTVLIGADGRIVECWRKVSVPGHVEAVIKAAESYAASRA
jgi:peroxiredoxin Q/BCP